MSSSSTSHAGLSNVLGPSPAAARIDLLISLQLHSWPALTLSIQNHWGGPTSNDKRDWFAGAVSDLLANGQVSDAEDLEEVLIQVMMDEFEVVVDDDSPAEISDKIMKGRERILQGDHSEVDQLLASWEEKQKTGQEKLLFKRVDENEDSQDTNWDSSEEEEEEEEEEEKEKERGHDEEGEADVEMDDAPQLLNASKQKKLAPEVDEDGFTKVLRKKKR